MINNEYEFQYPEFQEEEDEQDKPYMVQPELTKEEKLHYLLGAVSAGLMIAGVFLVAAFLFLLFCTKIWLR